MDSVLKGRTTTGVRIARVHSPGAVSQDGCLMPLMRYSASVPLSKSVVSGCRRRRVLSLNRVSCVLRVM